MANYKGTHSCGHDGNVDLIGPHKVREWKIEKYFSEICPACFKIQADKENEINMMKAIEMELPELKGTEKQIVWANTIRIKIIENTIAKNENIDLLEYIITNKTNASWWIDNRNTNIFNIVNLNNIKEEMNIKYKKDKEKIILDQLKEESTVYPENVISNVPVEIKFENDTIKVFFEKNDKFIEIIKSLEYKWNGVWSRKIDKTSGKIKDRVAELGNKLLNNGFGITIYDKEIRENAITGDFEAECTRWILVRTNGKYEGWFAIWFKERNDRLYQLARRIKGSIWDNPVILINPKHYKEIEEYAELNDFKISEMAFEIINNEKTKEKNIVVANIVEINKPKDGLKDILNSGDDILDDLKD